MRLTGFTDFTQLVLSLSRGYIKPSRCREVEKVRAIRVNRVSSMLRYSSCTRTSSSSVTFAVDSRLSALRKKRASLPTIASAANVCPVTMSAETAFSGEFDLANRTDGPLAVTHVRRGIECRYDAIYISPEFEVL